MSLLDVMENESDCIESIFQSYISSKSKKDIFLFFEGKDDFSIMLAGYHHILGIRNMAFFIVIVK